MRHRLAALLLASVSLSAPAAALSHATPAGAAPTHAASVAGAPTPARPTRTDLPFRDASGAPPVQGLVLNAVTSGDKAVLFAFQQLGKPYILGGNGPIGYDCSGLALASWMHRTGVGFARVSADQYHTAGAPAPLDKLSAGDLVFWGSTLSDWTSVYHTGIYVGGGGIVESTGDHVQLNSLDQWGLSDLMPHGVRP